MILVERPPIGVEVGDVLPGGRHQHLLDVVEATTRQHQEFEGVVETARVGVSGLQEGHQVAGAFAEHRGGRVDLPGLHPRPVGAHRVDLAVVGKHPERLGDRPRRERVGAVALVEDGEGRLEGGVDEIPVEPGGGGRPEQPLVDDGAGRRRRNAEAHQPVGTALHAAAGEVEQAFGGVAVEAFGEFHDRLFHHRHRLGGAFAEHRGVGGHDPPQQMDDPLGGARLLHDPTPGGGVIAGQERHHHTEPIAARHLHLGTTQISTQQRHRQFGE